MNKNNKLLTFLGTGSAFNTKLGNTSAYFKLGDIMLLIDCGSTVFSEIQKRNILIGKDASKEIYVCLTHFHPDHIGSLGDLIFYSYYNMYPCGLPKLTIIKNNAQSESGIVNLLRIQGISENLYKLVNIRNNPKLNARDDLTIYCHSIKLEHAKIRIDIQSSVLPHCEKDLITTVGYDIRIVDLYDDSVFNRVYYCGDTNEIPKLQLKLLREGVYQTLYIEACNANYLNNPHLNISKLAKAVKKDLRSKICCMHFDSDEAIQKAIDFGFDVAK